jgi:hypothetical protein
MYNTATTQQRKTASKTIFAVETSQEIKLKEIVKVDSRKSKTVKIYQQY